MMQLRPAGRPSTIGDKAPYEQPAKRSRFCSIYKGQGRKSTNVRNKKIFQRRRGSRFDDPDAAGDVTGRTLAPTRPKQTLETDFRMARI